MLGLKGCLIYITKFVLALLYEFVYCGERIIGGSEVSIEDFAYQLSLR